MMKDIVQLYAQHKGWEIGSYNVLVEGMSDYEVFCIAAEMHFADTGEDLFRGGLKFICAGPRHEGGTHGVVRELTVTRSLAKYALNSGGLERYRFVGLVDDDPAGRQAVVGAHVADASVLEYRDIFRLRPNMVCGGSSGGTDDLRDEFEKMNRAYKAMHWELEDLLSIGFMEAFCRHLPGAMVGKHEVAGRVHWEMTRKGKRELREFVRERADAGDLVGVVCAIRSLRFCLGLAWSEVPSSAPHPYPF